MEFYGSIFSMTDKEGIKHIIKGIIFTIVFGLFSWVFFYNAFYNLKVRHEVIIEDMAQFDYEKYKIVDQRGKIFIIEEIEKE